MLQYFSLTWRYEALAYVLISVMYEIACSGYMNEDQTNNIKAAKFILN